MQGYNRNRGQRVNYRNFDNNSNRNNNRRPQRDPQPSGLAVHLRDGDDINKALRKLKKKIERAGLMKELRDRQFYQKPSEKRRKAQKAGVMRWKKKQRELERDR